MDPAVLQEILGAGPLSEQQTANDQQLQDLIARRRAYQPSQHTTGLGSLFGGIADIIMQKKFQEGEQDLRTRGSDLATKMAGIRSHYGNALLGTPMGPAAPPGMPDNPPRIPLSPEDQGQLSMAAEMSGDPLMAKAGAGALLRGQQAPKLALETQQAQKAMQENQAMESPQAAMAIRALLGRLRQPAPENTPNSILRALLPTAEKAYQAELSSQTPKVAVNPVTGGLFDVRGSADQAGGAGGASDKRLPVMQEKFSKDLDPNNFRSGVLKGNQERSNAADRLLALAVDPITGGPADLTPQQMTELSTSLATLIGGGSSGEGTRHELTPYTKGRSFAGLMQWLTDEPHGTGQRAFVQQMIDTAKREQGVAQKSIRTAQAQRFSGHLPYFSLFPDAAKAQMQSFGFDPSEIDLATGKYTPKAGAAAPAAGPRPQRTVNGETREWDGKAWVPLGG